jgi:transposase
MSWLRARVAELEAENEVMAARLAARDAQLEAAQARLAVLAEQIEELRRRLDRDSSTSSKPPSSDSPYKKKPRDRSLRTRSGRKPGKQPGAPSSTLRQSGHPDDTVKCVPDACGACGADLAGEPVASLQRRQVFEAQPPPPPKVIGYQVRAKQCPACGVTTTGVAPAGVTSLVQYGPAVHAKAALAVCANYLPVARAARLVAAFTGMNVSAGFVAGVRGKAARRRGPFMERVRSLLRQAQVLYADETPARARGELHYVHIACTEFLTAMHTGGRAAEDIDAGQILPGYAGTIVRDGYAGYQHLTDALHAWCGAHGLRDLAGLYRFDPDGQVWARSMADLLIDANTKATAARAAGQASLSDDQLATIRGWYRGAVAKGITDNQRKRSKIAGDGLRLARRFRDHQDMILRFATDLTVGFTSNEAERGVRPRQSPAAHLRRMLAHPRRARRFRGRPVLPVHRRQMGHRRARRAHPALHRRSLATSRHPARLNSYLWKAPHAHHYWQLDRARSSFIGTIRNILLEVVRVSSDEAFAILDTRQLASLLSGS